MVYPSRARFYHRSESGAKLFLRKKASSCVWLYYPHGELRTAESGPGNLPQALEILELEETWLLNRPTRQ
jgi:hypothetical protein